MSTVSTASPASPASPASTASPSPASQASTAPDAACCTLQAARCAACTLGTSIDAYCATRGSDARCKVAPAWLTGRVWLGLTARVPEGAVIEGGGSPQKEQLGYTHYTPVWTLLDRPIGHNYGTSSQWIQSNDGVRDPQNRDLGWPWGSIEGGHMVSAPLGGARYQVNASTHRYSPWSDVAGGFGFSGGALPPQYWARVVLSRQLLLPPHGARRGQALRERVGRDAAVRLRQRRRARREEQTSADAPAHMGALSPTRWSMLTLEETSLFFFPGPLALFLLFLGGGKFVLPKRKTKGPARSSFGEHKP